MIEYEKLVQENEELKAQVARFKAGLVSEVELAEAEKEQMKARILKVREALSGFWKD